MTQQGESPVTSLDSVLDRFVGSVFSAADRPALQAALVAREDQMAGIMYLAGQQFGLFPQIVAEVLAEVGLGTPKTEQERAMIHSSFHELMAAIQRAQSGEGPMPTP